MSDETYDAKRAMQIIADRLATHIGSGDNAHLAVDQQHNGFMTPLMYLGLINAMGNRSQLPAGTDVFTLKPGHYTGTNLVNSSLGPGDSTVLMIDVYQYREYYTQIYETVSASGKLFVYTKHVGSDGKTNTYAPIGWAAIERTVTLWEGSVSDSNTKLVFADNIQNYPFLKITTLNPASNTIKKHLVKNQQEINVNDFYITSTSDGLVMSDMRIFIAASGNIEYSHGTDIKSSGVTPHVGPAMSLLKIEGVI